MDEFWALPRGADLAFADYTSDPELQRHLACAAAQVQPEPAASALFLPFSSGDIDM
jgi:hypothetical protein